MAEFSIQHNSEIQNGPSYPILRKHLIDNFNALDSAIGDRLRTTSGGGSQAVTPAVTFTGQITANGGLITSSSGNLSTNTINEVTANNGILIDGCLIKDGNARLGTTRATVTLSTGVNTGTDVITTDAAHGFATADPVKVRATSGSTLPTGLSETTQYYARNVSSTTITLHPTAADATGNTNIVDITAVGSGTIWIIGDIVSPSDGDFWYNDGFKGRHLGTNITMLNNRTAGCVLQVQQTTKLDTFTTSSTSFTDVTGMSVSITPSNTANKILVIAVLQYSTNATPILQAQLLRDSTAIGVGTASGSRTSAGSAGYTGGSAIMQTSVLCWLDSPASTSAQTYKIQFRASSANNVHLNRTDSDTDNTGSARTASTITAIEVVA
jgi:hypothetical protein